MKIFPLFPARKSKPCPQIDKTQADSTVPDDLIHKTIRKESRPVPTAGRPWKPKSKPSLKKGFCAQKTS